MLRKHEGVARFSIKVCVSNEKTFSKILCFVCFRCMPTYTYLYRWFHVLKRIGLCAFTPCVFIAYTRPPNNVETVIIKIRSRYTIQ